MKHRFTAVILLFVLVVSISVFASAEQNPKRINTETDTSHQSVAWQPPVQRWSESGTVDADASFAEYAKGLFYRRRVSFRSVSPNHLTGLSRTVYQALRAMVSEVADGQRTSTVFELPFDDLGVDHIFTAEDLSVTTITQDGEITQNAISAVDKKMAINLHGIINLLMGDAPYEMYWFDKTVDTEFETGEYIAYYDEDRQAEVLEVKGGFTFRMAVASAYAAGNYTLDPTPVNAAKTAAANARAIVAKYTSVSDAEKLAGYKNEICALVDYNYGAMNDESMPYGDPWQLIWVFDGDNNTNVVCEGYSKAFQYLCDQTTFESSALNCISVSGVMRTEEGAGDHMWNIVTMDDGYNYLADLTNSESGSPGEDGSLFLKECASGNVVGGYTLTTPGGYVTYTYDSHTTSTYLIQELTLKMSDSGGQPEDEEQSEEITEGIWTYVTQGTQCTVVRYDGDEEIIQIPEQLNGHRVTKIGNSVFMDSPIVRVIIPDGVKEIGSRAFFRCEALEAINLPDSIVSIGDSAFEECRSLQSVIVPSGVEYLGSYIFQRCMSLETVILSEGLNILGQGMFADCCALKEIDIPDSITVITDGAFCRTGLTHLEFPDSITTIEGSAFLGCTSLESIRIPSNVKSILFGSPLGDFGSFAQCSGLVSIVVDSENTNYKSESGVLFSKDGSTLLLYPEGRTGAYVVPSEVTYIQACAFAHCTGLTEISLPDNLEAIGTEAFSDCSGLKTIYIPDHAALTNIDTAADFVFLNCTALEEINVSPMHQDYFSYDGVLCRYNFGTVHDSSFDITDTYGKTIECYPCGKPGETFSISMDIDLIDTSAFASNRYLETIIIPGNVKRLRYMAFAYCPKLKEVVLEDGIEHLEDSLFYGSALKSITIPDSIIRISDMALAGCNSLEAIYCNSDSYAYNWAINHGYSQIIRTMGSEVISEGCWTIVTATDNTCLIKAYDGNESKLNIPETIAGYTVTVIADSVFSKHDELISVTIPQSVKTIGSNAFSECTSLKHVDLPAQLTLISDSLFEGCDNLTDIIIPENVTQIGAFAFRNCRSLKDVGLPGHVALIGHHAFQGCESISSFVIPSSVWFIEGEAFLECSNMKEIVILGEIREIGFNPFGYCNESLKFYCVSGSFFAQWLVENGYTNIVYDWYPPVYSWSGDNSNVTATRVSIIDEDMVETETVSVSYELAKAATCEAKGETTYTSAAFENEAFAVQTKTLEDVPALGHDWSEATYTWSDDNRSVTATRTCAHDSEHVETETATATAALTRSPTETQKGETTYSASFANCAFVDAIRKLEDIPSLGAMSVLRLPAMLSAIETEAFEGAAFEAVIVPDGCTSIGSRAFASCPNLIYVKISASVTSIADDAFEGSDQVRIDRVE